MSVGEPGILDSEEQIEAIATVFRCDRTSAQSLRRVLIPQRVSAKQILAHQGEPSHHCWIVIDGCVVVQTFGVDGQRQQLARHGPGEFFGAYPAPTEHRAEIEALVDSQFLRAEAQTLAALVATDAQIGAGMAGLLARQLDRALDRMATRSTYSAAGRVYSELLALADGRDHIMPAPRITTLALSANTTRETASRAVAVLIRRGIVEREDGRLVIHAPRMLRDMIV
ncbi:Crp/Fnr family transcriptional regulator [Sphingobium ummariense]|uniref:Cyclic nucleotide-binding protein n=1 Tax=Sphingobium ummariense RL-3 TaxID=1346791 RepID=T0J153_9SPHN|nr:Crp/Fnr family transcriptional regulator [Sphingobium ummariense]EQB30557.1 cyclic nucleotide-binding protein [Sphingobium ummariense RL-3]